MSNRNDLTALARVQAQQVLIGLPSYQSMSRQDKLDMYRRLVEQKLVDLTHGSGEIARQFAGPDKASDRIDDRRHENRRIEQAGELAGDFVDNINFPGFVRDLLKGVFDANLEVTLQQMAAYQELLKTATASVAKFVNAIDNTAAFGYLAENNSDEFSFDFDDNERDEAGNPQAVLTDKDGNKLDLGDNEIKARIMDAKIAMAKEQRALLRETILMGLTRMVVDKGVVKASVLFDIKASERIEKNDKAALKKSVSSGTSFKASGGLIGSVLGGPSGGHTRSKRKTEISISSAKSTASTDLAAKLAGSVEINFSSDYFKLDNFATMYTAPTEADRAQVAAGGGAPAR